MDKTAVRDFFDRCAPTWDAAMVRNEAVISEILNHAGVCAGIDVLDVACGTGVLFPDYLARNVNSVTAVDLSTEMVKIAREKFPQVRVFCGDAETMRFDHAFDVIMVYNAFPHFPEPERLIRSLSSKLKPGGHLSIAHGMSREKLSRHHSGSADEVSMELLPAQKLAEIFAEALRVDTVISDERMYQVCGTRVL